MNWKDVKKVNIGFYPTPLHEMKNLTTSVGKAGLFIKRDDMTGIGFGGNKLRKLEYIVKDAKDQGCTALLTYGGVHTNHGRLTAAAARLHGMKAIIMCYGQPPEQASGNLILDTMMDTEMVFMDTTDVRKLSGDEMIAGYHKLKGDSTADVLKRYEAQGDKVYIVPIGGHSLIGTLGYFNAVEEILKQMEVQKQSIDYLVTSHGSGGTFAGLWAGAKYFKAPFEVIGMAVSPLQVGAKETMADFINKFCDEYNLGITCSPDELNLNDDFTGEGYNIPDGETR